MSSGLNEIESFLSSQDILTSETNAVTKLESYQTKVSSTVTVQAQPAINNLLTALKEAYGTGAVKPSQSSAAVKWVWTNAGTKAVFSPKVYTLI